VLTEDTIHRLLSKHSRLIVDIVHEHETSKREKSLGVSLSISAMASSVSVVTETVVTESAVSASFLL
jgi:hypothetical protein